MDKRSRKREERHKPVEAGNGHIYHFLIPL